MGITYNDMQGDLGTTTLAPTALTQRHLRGQTALPVYPHMASGEVAFFTFQMSHEKALQLPAAQFHFHVMYTGVNGGTGTPAYGNTTFRIRWGWWNPNNGSDISALTELPNSSPDVSVDVQATDLWKFKILSLGTGWTPPTDEHYSSLLLVRVERLSAGNVYTGEAAIISSDIHIPVDRDGSLGPLTDD